MQKTYINREEAEKKLRQSRDRIPEVESNSGLQAKYDAMVTKSTELKYKLSSLEEDLKSGKKNTFWFKNF